MRACALLMMVLCVCVCVSHTQGPGAEDEDSEWGYQVVSNAAAAAHGGGAALPAASQQALHAITRLQTQLDAFCAELKAAKWKLAQETDVKEQALLDDRAAIVKEQASKAGGERMA